MYPVIVSLLVTALVAVYRAQPSPDLKRRELIAAGQAVVMREFDETIRTSFAGPEETSVEPLPDSKYRISGWVDLLTQNGGQDRRNYSCVVYKSPNGDWVGEHVAVIPQM
jgi:hypothetical protein